jgi:two-component system NtrC family sensor kinase
MASAKATHKRRYIVRNIIKRYFQFRNSVYSRVLLVIGLLSVFLLISYQIIFRTVNETYIKTAIYQNGNNIGSLVEGALYHSMLANDKMELQNTLDVINKLSGIDGVIMYDKNDNMAYSSLSSQDEIHIQPNCKECHTSIDSLFPGQGHSYRIIRVNNDCEMNLTHSNYTQLMIRTPIMNQPSCYTSTACHAHQPGEAVLGSLLIKMPLNDIEDAIREGSNLFTLLAVLITIIIASSLVLFTTKKIKTPLKGIIDASKAIATGDNTVRIQVKPDQLDDIRTLSRAFNHMMDNLEAANTELQNWSKQLEYKVLKKTEELGEIQNELINIERKASLGKLSSSVAHELNNPLSGILVYAKLINKKIRNLDIDPEIARPLISHIKLIEDETKRCGDIVKGLLDFSRSDQENNEPRHLHEILRETSNLVSHTISLSNVIFKQEFKADQDLISCNPNQVKQVFVALLVNSSEAVSENGEIWLRTYNPDKDHIIAEVTDNGSGIAEEDIPHIFEPFFTTKRLGNGVGLGLAIVHGIVQSHTGSIEVNSSKGKGTTISIKLPLKKEEN